MNVQYYHDRIVKPAPGIMRLDESIYFGELNPKGGETVALEVPEPWVLEALTVGDFFTKQIGKAKCSTEDNYNKKTGRDLARSRMKPTVLTVIDIQKYPDLISVLLRGPDDSSYLLEKRSTFTKVHFTYHE